MRHPTLAIVVPVLAPVFVLLAGCGSDDAETSVTGDGEVTYSSESPGGEAQITARNADGEEVTVSTGDSAAADLPAGFSVYPGARVVSNSTVATNDGQGSVLFMTTSDSPAQVATFYRGQAEAAGIDIGMEMTSGDSQMIGGESTDGKSFTVNATGTGEETTVQLMVGTKLSN